MSMQDKDIDALFSNKLKHLEIEPAAQVWKGIGLELDGAKRKNKLMPVIRLAAGLALFISTGLFFLMKESKTAFTAANNKSLLIKENAGNKVSTSIVTQIREDRDSEQPLAVQTNNAPALKAPERTAMLEDDEYPAEPIETKSRRIVDTEPELVAASAEQPITSDVPLAAYRDVSATDKFITAASAGTGDAYNVKPGIRKRGIRTLGDLINTVVAKVDNRENKLIEFSNTDDGGSVVSGVNLGIIRIKKD